MRISDEGERENPREEKENGLKPNKAASQ